MRSRRSNQRKNRVLFDLLILVWYLFFALSSASGSDKQIITTATQNHELQPGHSLQLSVCHETEPANRQTSGLLVRMHFNSQRVALISVENIYLPGFVQQQIQEDTQDWDADPATDRFLLMFWFASDKNWVPPSCSLFTATLHNLHENTQPTDIHFTAGETPPPFSFQGISTTLTTRCVQGLSGSIAQGLDPVVLRAGFACAPGSVDLTWRNLANDQVVATQTELFSPGPREQTTHYQLEVHHPAIGVATTSRHTILVGDHPRFADFNGDGRNTLADFHAGLPYWPGPGPDADGDGQFTIADLCHIATGQMQ